MIKRGEIYYVFRFSIDEAVGSEQAAGRPAIIVSNDVNNENSSVFEIVYLTTKEKPYQPTHVKIRASGRESTALCEQIHSVSAQKIGSYYGCCSEDEMAEIDKALAISIGIEHVCDDPIEESDDETLKRLYSAMLEAEARADMYEAQFNKLLDRITSRQAGDGDRRANCRQIR